MSQRWARTNTLLVRFQTNLLLKTYVGFPCLLGLWYTLPQKILGNSFVLIYPTRLILQTERIASFIFFSSLMHAVKACSKCSKLSKNSLGVT